LYKSLRRRGGSNQPADARARRVPADLHEGSARDFLRRHERESADAARKTGRERAEFARCLFRRAADSRNLRCAIDYLDREGGGAPGPDGLTIDVLDGQERWELARVLGATIRTGRYRPGPHREVQIPKGPGRGMRTLRIRNVQDRVVERAIVRVLQPFLDPTFAPASFGYRPRMGREYALAHAEVIAERAGQRAWVLDDVKDAFDNIPVRRLMDVVRKRIGADDIVELIRIVIDGGATKGIPQGCSLSPLLLNVYLDHALDRPWAKRQPANPLIRVADDLLVLARDATEAQIAHEQLRAQLRAAGMSLKAAPGAAVRDLRNGGTGDWLGYRLRMGPGGLEVLPTDRCWAQLEEALMLAHTKPAAPVRALEIIEGWAEQLGPCRPHLDLAGFHTRIASVATRCAFLEIPSRLSVEDRVLRGYRRWVSLRGRARRLLPMERITAAPPARV
jgi:Reverse transcriptase (RNA-dependent DNA polymerase)